MSEVVPPHETWSRRPGDLIGGRYHVIRPLGAGGMGEVYEVEHTVIKRRFAAKVMRRDLASATMKERFEREARAAGSLHSPHVVAVTDYAESDDGAPCIVMELLHGETLGTMIRRGPLVAATAVEIVRQAALGVADAHRAGLIHRDLKPENIFLCRKDVSAPWVKVLDFGVAKVTEVEGAPADHAATRTGATVGTPSYMSPEQAKGLPVESRSDVYALGVVLYEALAGKRPFSAEGYNAIVYAILSAIPPRLGDARGDLPPGLEAIVEKAMARAPEARFESASALAQALTDLGARSASALTQSQPDSLAEVPSLTWEVARRSRYVTPRLLIAGGVGLAIVGALALSARSLRTQQRPVKLQPDVVQAKAINPPPSVPSTGTPRFDAGELPHAAPTPVSRPKPQSLGRQPKPARTKTSAASDDGLFERENPYAK